MTQSSRHTRCVHWLRSNLSTSTRKLFFSWTRRNHNWDIAAFSSARSTWSLSANERRGGNAFSAGVNEWFIVSSLAPTRRLSRWQTNRDTKNYCQAQVFAFVQVQWRWKRRVFCMALQCTQITQDNKGLSCVTQKIDVWQALGQWDCRARFVYMSISSPQM